MFDLSMQSALDIFCYVLVLIYGLALSADLSTGGYVSRQQKYLLTLLCLLIPNRAVSAVAAILLMFGLIVVGSVFYNALCEPEMASAAVMTANGFEVGEPEPNPNYVSGALRTVYQFIVDALPTGQAILLVNQELAHPAVSLCASVGIVLLSGAVGMAIFKRKDLK